MKRILGAGAAAAIAAVGLVVLLSSSSPGQVGPAFGRAPASAEFAAHVRARSLGLAPRLTADGHGLGLIPLPMEISPVRPRTPRLVDRAMPSYYDLRTSAGKLSPIRDQGNCGSCWSFATYGSLESVLRPGEANDFSEQNMIDHSGFSLGRCDGGNITMATAYLARWSGPLNESKEPYRSGLALDGAPKFPGVKHFQTGLFLPARASASDNDLIKTAVALYGAVYVSMNWVSSGYNPAFASFYNAGAYEQGGGHAVCVVGWDDAFPAGRFNVPPPGDGAFIVRNSWGTAWGDAGYFYVSYHDTNFGRMWFNAVFHAQSAKNYKSVYQYDPLGWVTSFGASGGGVDTCWSANVFKAAGKTPLAAVGTYAVSSNGEYEIFVYGKVKPGQPRSGTLLASTSGSWGVPGFYTVPLPKVVMIPGGQKFSVVVKYRTPGYGYPVPAETYLQNYSEAAKSKKGESFIDLAGAENTNWTDFYVFNAQADACIKAYVAGPPSLTVTSPATGNIIPVGGTPTIEWSKTGAQAAFVKIQLFRGAAKALDIAAKTDNDGVFEWVVPPLPAATTYSIRITTIDGKVKGASGKFTIIPDA